MRLLRGGQVLGNTAREPAQSPSGGQVCFVEEITAFLTRLLLLAPAQAGLYGLFSCEGRRAGGGRQLGFGM